MAKKQRLIDETALPGPSARLDQANMAAQALSAAGYVAIGLDHFALPDDSMAKALGDNALHRNFQGYTTDPAETMLGLGTTSIGKTSDGFVQNIPETGAWTRAVEAGTLPIGKGIACTSEDKLRGYVIERLMCVGSVDLKEAGVLFGAPLNWYYRHKSDLTVIQFDGLIKLEGDTVSVTPDGAPLVRIVASVFDTYFSQASSKHAVAV
jgi:oxygen-independent coproporphyrinogen-3 oxidase